MSAGARSSTIATLRSLGVSPASKVLASVSSPARARKPACGPCGTTAGLAPRKDGALPMTCPSASVTWIATWCPPTRHDHGARASGSPKTANQYSSGSRRVQPPRPPSRSSAPRTVSSAMTEATSPAVRCAQRRAEDRPSPPLRCSGLMSRSASPSRVPGVYAQTNRSFVSNGKTAAARCVASSPSSHARAAAVISSAAAVTR